MKKTLRLAIAGFGLVGKRHAEAIARQRDVELAAVVDPAPKASEFAHEQGHRLFADLETMFAEERPDGVILATPTPMHVAQGLQAIAYGCPVLVEKPIAVTAAEAACLVEAADRAGVPLLVGHHRRHNPLIRKAREIIEAGAIGRARAVHGHCWFYKPDPYFEDAPWRKKKGAGPISVNLVHDVDLIRYLCGEVISVQAQKEPSRRGFENEDLAVALLRFDSGVLGTITVSDSIAAPWSWELTSREYPIYPPTSQSCYMIGGSKGSLSIPDLTLWAHGETPDWWSPISATSVPRDSSDPLVNQIAHFANVIRGVEPPLVSGWEGMRTLQVIEAIQTSAATNRTIELTMSEDAAVNSAGSAPDCHR